jgi:lipopolysaccharide heptosyltransferase I
VNVALVKLSSLGDVVHALPVAATLRARWPSARLTWIVERREAAVLAGHPALDEVVAVDTRRWRRVRRPGDVAGVVREIAALAGRLRAARFDVALDVQGLLKSGALAWLTRAPLRVGFTSRRCREPLSAAFTNRRVAPPAGGHVVEQYLALLEPLGAGPNLAEFHLPCDAVVDARIDEVCRRTGLEPVDRLVAISPGAGRPDKRWPAERFAALARRLAVEAGALVLVVWGPGEDALAGAVVQGAAHAAVTLAPPTDLGELVAILRRACLVVAADTGPLHVAAALGVPCVGLYGPTRAERNGPYGFGHTTISAPDGRMASIDAAAVFQAAGALLRERAASPPRPARP